MSATLQAAAGYGTDEIALDTFATPIGTMLVVFDREGLVRAVDWEDYAERMHRLLRVHCPGATPCLAPGTLPATVRDALAAYFEGDLDALAGLAVQTRGTPFQREVWAALRTIPAGRTLSYSALAEQVGRPRAVRAVGLANGSNPVGVVVPCHRVIGANGALTGYGGGVQRKRWLLRHEGAEFLDR